MSGLRLFGTCLVSLQCLGVGAAPAETSTIAMPQSSLACLYDNQQRYLDLPKNVLIFFPTLCPAISREEVAAIVQNSGAGSGDTQTRAIMLKSEFICLVELIGQRLEDSEDLPEDPGAIVEFELDCI